MNKIDYDSDKFDVDEYGNLYPKSEPVTKREETTKMNGYKDSDVLVGIDSEFNESFTVKELKERVKKIYEAGLVDLTKEGCAEQCENWKDCEIYKFSTYYVKELEKKVKKVH